MSTSLNGRVALVTGGLRGIGYETCRHLIDAGCIVYAADLSAPDDPETQAIMATLGDRARYLRLDVAEEASWVEAAAAIRAQAERLDILVSNAGTDLVGRVDDITLADWHRLMRVNVDGVFLATKHMAALLDATGRTTPAGSSIINVSSIMGLVGLAETSAYNTSKGAVRLFSKATAVEFARARRPIRVNSVHPGFVRTPLLAAGMRRWVAAGVAPDAETLIDGLAQRTPMGRVADPAEIAAVICFLASDASSYMTGAEIAVDGGWTAE